jgi:uncharacterized protein YecT (DUF1311 family)
MSTWCGHALLQLLEFMLINQITLKLLIVSFLISLSIPAEAELNCSKPKKLPHNYTCAPICDGDEVILINCKQPLSRLERIVCSNHEMALADVKLNELYNKLMKSLQQPDEESASYSEVRKALLESQRAWLKFRVADCHFVDAVYMGGEAHNIASTTCMKDLTLDRVKYLEHDR